MSNVHIKYPWGGVVGKALYEVFNTLSLLLKSAVFGAIYPLSIRQAGSLTEFHSFI